MARGMIVNRQKRTKMPECAKTPIQAHEPMKARGPVASVARRPGDPGPFVFVRRKC